MPLPVGHQARKGRGIDVTGAREGKAIPGFFNWADLVAADAGPNQIGPYDVFSSLNTQALALYDYDPVVLGTDSASVRLRKLTQDDITAAYLNTTACGILGFAPANLATDANGNSIAVPSALSLAGNVANVYPINSMAQYGPSNLATGRQQSSVISCQNLIGGNLWETTAVTGALNGTMVGILISTITGYAPTFFWSTAATTKIGRIWAVDTQNPRYNVTGASNVQDTTHKPRCPVAVQIVSAYDQYQLVTNYGD